jgi:hypothetical protein
MRTNTRILRWATILLLAVGSVSCMTTYDSTGRPVQSVDPAVAVAGAAAAGLVGYALANDRDERHYHHYQGSPHYNHYGRPYRRY